MKNRIGSLITHSLLLLFVTAWFATPNAIAQSSSGGGTIQGTVKDATGAIIPGAKVRVTHQATGRVFNSEANGEGFFVTPSIAIGRYKVRVEAQGMKAWEGELNLETGRISNSYNPNNQNGFKPRQLQGTLRVEW